MNGDDTDRRFWFPRSPWGGGSVWRVKITSSKQHPTQHRQSERFNSCRADLPSSFSSSSSDLVRNCRGFPTLFSSETKSAISVNQSHPPEAVLGPPRNATMEFEGLPGPRVDSWWNSSRFCSHLSIVLDWSSVRLLNEEKWLVANRKRYRQQETIENRLMN